MGEGYWERYESVVDQRIREAQEAGAFDDLPGAGKPLKGLHGPDDPNWWLRSYLEREGLSADSLLPTPLRLRKEIDRLPATVRDLGTEQEVRAAVREINQRVAAHLRHPTGPRVIVRPASPDDVVAGWRASRVRVAGAGAGSPVEGRAGEPGPEPRARERRRRWFWRRGR